MVSYQSETCPNCDQELMKYGDNELECKQCGRIELRECPPCNKSFIAFPAIQKQYLMDNLWVDRRHRWYRLCPQCRSKETRPESEWEVLRMKMKEYSDAQLTFKGFPPEFIKLVKSSKKNPELMVS